MGEGGKGEGRRRTKNRCDGFYGVVAAFVEVSYEEVEYAGVVVGEVEGLRGRLEEAAAESLFEVLIFD